LRREVEVLRKERKPSEETRISHMGCVRRWLMHAETIFFFFYFSRTPDERVCMSIYFLRI
jgi:hypothetical protein